MWDTVTAIGGRSRECAREAATLHVHAIDNQTKPQLRHQYGRRFIPETEATLLAA